MPLRPFSLTHVLYEQGDHLGWLCALFSLAPVFIVVSLVTSFVNRRDLTTFTFLLGTLFNEILNFALKSLLKEPRPEWGKVKGIHDHAPAHGMPSNHAQFAGFNAAWILLWIAFSWRSVGRLWRFMAALAALMLGLVTAGSRVYLHYHDTRQIAVGLAVGALFASLWYFLVLEKIGRQSGLFAWVVKTPLAQWLLVRDCSGNGIDVLTEEYKAISKATSASSASVPPNGKPNEEEEELPQKPRTRGEKKKTG